MTLAVNQGTLITYDRDALSRWRSSHRSRASQGPAEFTSTVSRLAQMFPGKVTTH